jgi:hypothetical protein
LIVHDNRQNIKKQKTVITNFIFMINNIFSLLLAFMFMTAWVLQARLCPTLLNEIKKTNFKFAQNPKRA